MNADAAAPPARVGNSPPLSLAWFLSLLPLGPRSVFAVPPCHIGSIRWIARGAAMAPDPRRLVDRQVVWLGFSAPPLEIRAYGLQLLPVHFLVPADRLDRLFRTHPGRQFSSHRHGEARRPDLVLSH